MKTTKALLDEMYAETVNKETHRIAMWDMDVAGGKCRIAGLVPLKPADLDQPMPFAISWCCPSDMKKWSKVKASHIALGRLKKALREPLEKFLTPLPSGIRHAGNSLKRNVCYVQPSSLKREDVAKAVFAQTYVPDWVLLSVIDINWDAAEFDTF